MGILAFSKTTHVPDFVVSAGHAPDKSKHISSIYGNDRSLIKLGKPNFAERFECFGIISS